MKDLPIQQVRLESVYINDLITSVIYESEDSYTLARAEITYQNQELHVWDTMHGV
jgi:hypothetical protein